MTQKMYTEAEVVAMMSANKPVEKPASEWDKGVQELDALLCKVLGNKVMDDVTHAFQLAKDSGISTGTDAKGKAYKIGAKAFGDVFATRAYILASEASKQEAKLIVQPTPTGNIITVAGDTEAVKPARKQGKAGTDDAVLSMMERLMARMDAIEASKK